MAIFKILRLQYGVFLIELAVFLFEVVLLIFQLLILLWELIDFLLQSSQCSLNWFGLEVWILNYWNGGRNIVLFCNTIECSCCHPVLGLGGCFLVFEFRWQMTSLYHVFKLFIGQVLWINLRWNDRGFDLDNVSSTCILFGLISLVLHRHSFWHVYKLLRFILTDVTSRWPISDSFLTLEISLIFF